MLHPRQRMGLLNLDIVHESIVACVDKRGYTCVYVYVCV